MRSMKNTRVAHPEMMKRDWINRRMMYWVMAPGRGDCGAADGDMPRRLALLVTGVTGTSAEPFAPITLSP